jgi:uncharacterized repeat protein (TIGR02543 family)/LPXTG-motif cell wall-anchored protein
VAGQPASIQLYTDQTTDLPVTPTREGYDFEGWTNQQHVASVSATTTVSDLTGYESQAAHDALKNNGSRSYDTGAVWTAQGSPSYVMPTLRTDNSTDAQTITLYAVWRAKDDVVYHVERYIVTGDGDLRALKADGTVDRDANQKPVVHANEAAYAQSQRLEYRGTADEIAWGDGTDGTKSYRHVDNIPVEGYSFVANTESYLGHTTYAKLAIKGDGSTVLVLIYQPREVTLTLGQGSGDFDAASAIAAGWTVGDDGSISRTLKTDQTIVLPANVATSGTAHMTRAGYTLIGWTTQESVTPSGASDPINVGTSTGIASQQAAATAEALAGNLSITGAEFTAQAGTYLVPSTLASALADETYSGAVQLHAVWRANDNTSYYVERWVITGDDIAIALNNDGSVPYDAESRPVAHEDGSDWVIAQRIAHVGITDEVAWADLDDDLSYHNADNIGLDGYAFIPHTAGASVEGHTTIWTTIARKQIAGDGQMVIKLYYIAGPIAPYVVNHWRVTGDGTFKELLTDVDLYNEGLDPKDQISQNVGKTDTRHYANVRTGDATDTAHYNHNFIGYHYVDSVVVGGVTYTSVTDGNIFGDGHLVLDIFYLADADITLTLNPGGGAFSGDVIGNAHVENHATESSFRLPDASQMYRAGYDFVGWAYGLDDESYEAAQAALAKGETSILDADHIKVWGDNFSGAAIASKNTSAGDSGNGDLTGQSLFAASWLRAMSNPETLGGSTYANPAYFFIAGGDYFLMPTTNVTLYAIWRARDDVHYEVSHYLIDVNGEAREIEDDNKAPNDAVEGNDTYTHPHITDESVAEDGITEPFDTQNGSSTPGADDENVYRGYTYMPTRIAPAIDAEGNPIFETDDEGNPVYVTDADGNPVYQRDAANNILTDAEGNPLRVQRQLFDIISMEDLLDSAGNVVKPAGSVLTQLWLTSLGTANPDGLTTQSSLQGDGTTHLRYFYVANVDTEYFVERWIVNGDGLLVPLGTDADGNPYVPHDADGKPVVVDDEGNVVDPEDYEDWAATQRVRYIGVTGDEAWADEDVEGVSYRNFDSIALDGYEYIVNGTSIFDAEGNEYYTVARATILGDGTLVLRLYYLALPSTFTLDPNYGVWEESFLNPSEDEGSEGEGAEGAASEGAEGAASDAAKDTSKMTPAERMAEALRRAGGTVEAASIRRQPNESQHASDNTIILPTGKDVVRNGYRLVGWQKPASQATDELGNPLFDDDGNPIMTPGEILAPGSVFYMPTYSITLTAVWEALTYTIYFDKNDSVATGDMEKQTYTYGDEDAKLDLTGFDRRNAKFLGWAFSKDATTPDFTPEQLLEALTIAKHEGLVPDDATIDDPNTAMFLLAAMGLLDDTTEITLYAVWDIERHQPTLEGGTAKVDEESGITTITGEYDGGTVVIRFPSEGIEPGFTLTRDDVTIEPRDGWYLKGWYVTQNGVRTYIEDPDAIFSIMMDADTTFEPVFGNYAAEAAARGEGLYGYGRGRRGLPQTGDDPQPLPLLLIAALASLLLAWRTRREEV